MTDRESGFKHVSDLRKILAAALALAEPIAQDAERDFLQKAGWIPLGAEAGTGIDSWTTLARGLTGVVSREQALKLSGFPAGGKT